MITNEIEMGTVSLDEIEMFTDPSRVCHAG